MTHNSWSYDRLRDVARRAADGSADAGPAGEVSPNSEEVLSALESLRAIRDELADWEPLLIGTARQQGTSWAELAPVLGVASRQAAERRYLRMRKTDPEEEGPGGGETADGRVQAERDRRAGERAVHEWAHTNSGAVRALAAMVSALGADDGLDDTARRRIDIVHRRLGGDPVVLLPALEDVVDHLESSHPELAERVRDLNAGAQRARQAVLDRRIRR